MNSITASTYYDQVIDYDNFIKYNYQKLRRDARTIFQNNESFEDALHDKIVKVRDRIIKSGFTSTNYYGAVWRAIKNQFITEQTTKREYIDIIDFDFKEESDEREQYFQQTERKVKYVFQFINERYPAHWATLFEIYYMSNSNTYEKIVNVNGYKMRYVKDCISKMKKDLKQNLDSYIKEQERKL